VAPYCSTEGTAYAGAAEAAGHYFKAVYRAIFMMSIYGLIFTFIGVYAHNASPLFLFRMLHTEIRGQLFIGDMTHD